LQIVAMLEGVAETSKPRFFRSGSPWCLLVRGVGKYSILMGNSYLVAKGSGPDIVFQLDGFLVREDPVSGAMRLGRPYALHVIDMMEKLGYMCYSMDRINEYDRGRHPLCQKVVKFYTCSFIFHTKALLDSVANLLNVEYCLRFSGSEIDLKRDRFLIRLGQENKRLVHALSSFREWFKAVARYRDALIHKRALLLAWVAPGPPPESPTAIVEPCQIPVEPIELFDREAWKRLAERYGSAFRPVGEFCSEYMGRSSEVVCLVLRDLRDNLLSGGLKVVWKPEHGVVSELA